jgi:NuA3 HAT complex component NTO1
MASPVNEAITNLVTQPNGVVIIEQLDTPAIRREKHMRRKAEKQRLAGVAASAPVSVDSSGKPSLPPPTSGVSSFASPPPATGASVATSQALRPPPLEAPGEQLHEDFDSELSELSDDETDADALGEPDDEVQDEIAGDVTMPPPAPSLPALPPMESAPKEPPQRKKSSRKKVLKPKVEPFEDGTIGMWTCTESCFVPYVNDPNS